MLGQLKVALQACCLTNEIVLKRYSVSSQNIANHIMFMLKCSLGCVANMGVKRYMHNVCTIYFILLYIYIQIFLK